MIDGNDDDTKVNIGVLDATSDDYHFGYYSEGFFKIPGATSFSGGSVIDFAIQNAGTITRASEGTAEMVFSGAISASNSANPVVSDDYWKGLAISWSDGGGFDMVGNISGLYDGFAPAPAPTHAPEPATLFLLGTGLIGLAGFGRKKLNKKG